MRNTRRAGILVAAATATMLGTVPAWADHGGKHCDELPANIDNRHPDWHDSLDRNGDGIGCDKAGAPRWEPDPEPSTPPAPAPTEPPAPAPTEPPPPEPQAPPVASPAQPVERQPSYTG